MQLLVFYRKSRPLILPLPFFRNYYCQFRLFSKQFNNIENLLSLLETGQDPSKFRKLLSHLPYFCNISGLSKRFIPIVDRWWHVVLRNSENGTRLRECLGKPTSVVFHLGRMNKDHDGAIMKRLGVLEMEKLIEAASSVDFSTLPERDDVLSYLTGIRDLLRKPGSYTIIYPSLKPNAELFRNLERYFERKVQLRNRLRASSIGNGQVIGEQNSTDKDHINSTTAQVITTDQVSVQTLSIDQIQFQPTSDSDSNFQQIESDWLFTINKEAPETLYVLREMAIPLSTIQRSTKTLLPILCRLCKENFDSAVSSAEKLTNYDEAVKFLESTSLFADACLFWNYDPDRIVSGVWSSWFEIYELGTRSNHVDVELKMSSKYLDLLKYVPQVVVRFGKHDLFRRYFHDWMANAKFNFDRIVGSKPDGIHVTYTDYAKCLIDFLYDLGQLVGNPKIGVKGHGRGKFNYAESPVKDFYDMLWKVLQSIHPTWLDDITLQRYLTTLRNYVRSKSCLDPSGTYLIRFNDELVNFLNGYFNGKLKTKCRDINPHQVSIALFLLKPINRLHVRLDIGLWTSMISVFERGFIGRSGELFQSNPTNYRRTLLNFGAAYVSFRRRNKDFEVSSDLWREYFSGAKLILENVEAGNGPNQANTKAYGALLMVLLDIAIYGDCLKEFEIIKLIWQTRQKQLAYVCDSGTLSRIISNMNVLKRKKVDFDLELFAILKSRRNGKVVNKDQR